jgi:hypothetical protein
MTRTPRRRPVGLRRTLVGGMTLLDALAYIEAYSLARLRPAEVEQVRRVGLLMLAAADGASPAVRGTTIVSLARQAVAQMAAQRRAPAARARRRR